MGGVVSGVDGVGGNGSAVSRVDDVALAKARLLALGSGEAEAVEGDAGNFFKRHPWLVIGGGLAAGLFVAGGPGMRGALKVAVAFGARRAVAQLVGGFFR